MASGMSSPLKPAAPRTMECWMDTPLDLAAGVIRFAIVLVSIRLCIPRAVASSVRNI